MASSLPGRGKAASRPQGFRLLTAHRSITVGFLFLFFIPLLYFNSLGNDFTNWDDQMIYANPKIRSLDWKNVLDMFVPGQGTYQPVRVFSYAVDYRFWRLNPLGYHLTNVFFYLLTCLVLLFMIPLLLKNLFSGVSRDSLDRVTLFTALLFSAHPVHVEAVTWLAARKEVLHGFFLFLSFYLYLRTGEIREASKRRVYIGFVFLTFLLAVLSKPSAVILPGLFILYEVSRERSVIGSLMRERWLLFTVSGVISLVFVLILFKSVGGATAFLPFYGGSLLSNLIVAMNLVLYNIKLLIFTTDYSAAYTITASFGLLSKWTMMVFGVTLLLTLAALWSRRKTSLFFFSFFWFLIAVSPFLNIFPISILLADRYVYIASFGYCLVMGFLINRLYEVRSGTGKSVVFKSVALLLFLTLLSGYSWMTIQQNKVWKDSFSLWSDAVRKYPEGNLANAMMGGVSIDQGRYERALPYLEKAIRIRPSDVISRKNLGIAYMKLGDFGKAIKEFLTVLQQTPEDETLKFTVAILYGEQKEYRKSEEILDELIRKRPDEYLFHLHKGYLHEETGQFEEALREYERSIRLAPQQPSPYRQLGDFYLYRRKDLKKAIGCYAEALKRTEPSDPKAEQLRWIIQDLSPA
jgi:protein O-mannosyl-transferase